MNFPPKPEDIIGRDTEWATLARSWERERPELVFVLGRRRVGKSFMLSRFAQQVGGVYYQATRRTESEQLASLNRAIGEHFGDAALTGGAVLPSWEALFEYVSAKTKGSPFLLVLDEFPYLASAANSLTSILQKHWDHAWQESRIRLVLCGSYIAAMQQLEQVDQPLHGRRTAKIAFNPFSCRGASRFVPGWSARERMKLYGTLGNLPGHLALVDPNRSLAENIAELVLNPSGRLADEAQHMLDAFVGGTADVHYSIIEAIATGDRTWNGITRRVGKTGGALSRPLAWLESMQLVERVVPITERRPERSKRALYRISDPYVHFWHSWVAPLASTGSLGLAPPEELWSKMIAPRLDHHMGPVFEQICREHAWTLEAPFRPVRVGSYWDATSQNEIDVVALSADGELLVGECKWGAVSGHDLEQLRKRAQVMIAELEHVGPVHFALFSGRGEADESVKSAAARRDVLFFGPEEILG